MPQARPSGSTTATYAGEWTPKRSLFGGGGALNGLAGGAFGATVVAWPADTSTVWPCAATWTIPSVVWTALDPSGWTSVMNPVPRTAAVELGVFSSKRLFGLASLWTLAQVRPMAWLIRMVIEPSVAEVASSMVTVVSGSSSRVEPSKNVTTAWLAVSVRTRSPAMTTSPSVAAAKAPPPRAIEAEPSSTETVDDEAALRVLVRMSRTGTMIRTAASRAMMLRLRRE